MKTILNLTLAAFIMSTFMASDTSYAAAPKKHKTKHAVKKKHSHRAAPSHRRPRPPRG